MDKPYIGSRYGDYEWYSVKCISEKKANIKKCIVIDEWNKDERKGSTLFEYHDEGWNAVIEARRIVKILDSLYEDERFKKDKKNPFFRIHDLAENLARKECQRQFELAVSRDCFLMPHVTRFSGVRLEIGEIEIHPVVKL
jgi:hypothetical protein